MTPTLIATAVILALAVVFLRAERRELAEENARLQRQTRHRWRTAQQVKRLRYLHRNLEAFVNSEDDGDGDGGRLCELLGLDGQDWRLQ